MERKRSYPYQPGLLETLRTFKKSHVPQLSIPLLGAAPLREYQGRRHRHGALTYRAPGWLIRILDQHLSIVLIRRFSSIGWEVFKGLCTPF